MKENFNNSVAAWINKPPPACYNENDVRPSEHGIKGYYEVPGRV
ncbi:MAG TPA: hypothetical protein VFR58_08290 [Flavisolibacter sp.]|nr:hypothetical protein [Flavisolibacter sp.]